MNHKNRRQFLKSCCRAGAVGMAAHMTRLAPISLMAQGAGDYKALVCVFMFGGNDANNMIVPIDGRYGAYSSMRGGTGSTGVALPLANLRPVGSAGYGLHPSLVNMQAQYGQQRVAMVFNVGTLFEPMTRAQYQNGSIPKPVNLYSHSDQTQQWQTSIPSGGATGWGGRLNDVTLDLNTGALPPGITVNGGTAMFLNGTTTQGLNYSNADSFGLHEFGEGTAMTARLDALQRILTFDSGAQLVSAANGVLTNSIRSAQEINDAVNSAPPIPAGITFPGTGLGQQLRQVAQIIAVHGALGMNRQIFFTGTGGFDNHEDLLNKHVNLMNGLDQAVDAFVKTLEARGQLNMVTLFTESEFNRTGNTNANIGSDHAWGGHHLVIGGAVQGGEYGTFPTHLLNGPDDAGDRGYWIPTTATDQYAATLGRWFGATTDELNTIFPNLGKFPSGLLSFV